MSYAEPMPVSGAAALRAHARVEGRRWVRKLAALSQQTLSILEIALFPPSPNTSPLPAKPRTQQ